jgi:hypothetical protein
VTIADLGLMQIEYKNIVRKMSMELNELRRRGEYVFCSLYQKIWSNDPFWGKIGHPNLPPTTQVSLFVKYLIKSIYIQGVSKMFEQISIVRSSKWNKENFSYKHIFGNEWLLSLIDVIYSTLNAVTVWCFTYNWRNTFTVHIPTLVTVEFLMFIKS